MSANTFGERFKVTTFGESHGVALGAVIDGMPAGIEWDEALLRNELNRRRPGQSNVVTSRNEKDEPEVLSGVFEGKTLGTPIAVIVRNSDARSEDYKEVALSPRAGHADDVWKMKFGHSDPRGGGRSSGRETLCRVIAGAAAKMLIARLSPKTQFISFARSIGPLVLDEKDRRAITRSADAFVARFPAPSLSASVEKLLLDAKENGKSYGGIGELWIDHLPSGLGQPVFHKLKADLSSAMLGIGATSGVEFGAGFDVVGEEGSEFHGRESQDGYGGVRGGISTGERLSLCVAFKPTSSVLDVAKMGRHDPCIVPRALPVMESMAAIVIADHLLWKLSDRI